MYFFLVRLAGEGQERQLDGEDGTLPGTAAGRFDRSPVQFDEMPRDCQAEPQAAVEPGLAALFLLEPLEDARQELRIDSPPVVPHGQLHMRIDARHGEHD